MSFGIKERSLVGSTLAIQTKNYIKEASEEGSFAGEVKTHLFGRVFLLGTGMASALEASIRLITACFAQAVALLTFYQSKLNNAIAKKEATCAFEAILLTTASLVALISPRLFPTLFTNEEYRKREVVRIEEATGPIQTLAQAIVRVAFLPLELTVIFFAAMVETTAFLMLLPFRIMLLPFELMLLPFRMLFSPPERRIFSF